jgi:threonylcarbamoyladenosine tRNA methylthiotransferase MtaB
VSCEANRVPLNNRYDNTVGGYYIENFGCRAAQADGSAIERQLSARGMHRANAAAEAKLVVLNTCTVTAAADQDARAAVRRILRQQPDARILVTGCYAQRAPNEIAQLEGVTWVVGNSHKHRIGEIVSAEILAGSQAAFPDSGNAGEFIALKNLGGTAPFAPLLHVSDIFAHTELVAAPVFEGTERTRPNLKVQDGCDNRCSFCVIPSVRGHSRSLPLAEVLREIRELEQAVYREIVISGINLGRWGRDLPEQDRFVHLLHAILESTAIEKLRLSSIEPMDWNDELIQIVASSPRIAKHVHMPLQSGSDRILRRMHRKYRPWHYAEKIEKVRALMPDAAIGADVMVGFPGESDELFEESRSFIAALPFTYLHVFTYSPRPGTPAAAASDQVPLATARERNRILRELAAEKNLEFRRRFIGRTLEAITLGDTACGHQLPASGSTSALSDNYLKVEVEGEHEANQWIKVQVQGLTSTGLSGVPPAIASVSHC